jgi:hypothetical protein
MWKRSLRVTLEISCLAYAETIFLFKIERLSPLLLDQMVPNPMIVLSPQRSRNINGHKKGGSGTLGSKSFLPSQSTVVVYRYFEN